MSDAEHRNSPSAKGFMGRLVRDKRGNTMAIMAAALIPLAGMVGGGVDIARMYIVKTRLQHACDAGALAGRKAMGGGTWSQTVGGTANYPNYLAGKFFDANYQSTAYGATGVTRSFTESAGKVSGTASAQLPMTLMKIFGQPTQTLSVACDAEMRLPNTDVMFVLDTTGSMDDKAVSSDPVDKISALKVAVKCFYEIVARLDTDATCTGGAPSGGTGNQVQIRFGFVPYSVNVNVGKLLPTAYFPNSWDYQTREVKWTYTTTYNTTWAQGTPAVTNTSTENEENSGSWSYYSNANKTESQCNNLSDPANSDYTLTGSEGSPYSQSQSGSNPVTYTWKTKQDGWYYRWRYTYTNRRCELQRRKRTYDSVKTYSRTDTGTTTSTVTKSFGGWDYKKRSIDISGLKNGTNWNGSFNVPEIGSNGSDRTVNWNGCIEERQTISGTSFSPIPATAKDLDIDSVPTSDVTTQWKPALGELEYMRRNSSYTNDTVTVTPSDRGYANWNLDFSQPSAYCPVESRKLQTWSAASTFDTYVDSLTPVGNTYHDIGLLWGARLMSPTGIFKSENEYTPQGGEIERHLIFMTDGDTQTSTENYAAYGLPWYDRRNVAAGDVGSSPGATTMNDEVNARFLALCTAIKNKNITLWVISFGSGSNSTTETRLSQCATPGRYFVARDSATLQTTFRSIADQISQLRLTR